MVASGISQDVQTKALLLHMASTEVQDFFDTLEVTGATSIDAINDYFVQKNTAYENMFFIGHYRFIGNQWTVLLLG